MSVQTTTDDSSTDPESERTVTLPDGRTMRIEDLTVRQAVLGFEGDN